MKKNILVAVIISILALALFYQISRDQAQVIKQINLEINKKTKLERENIILKKIISNEDFNEDSCVQIQVLEKILNDLNLQKKEVEKTKHPDGCYIGKLTIVSNP
ncbi:hypothetical protein OAI92_01795 [Candidatus Pelagibacter sp.]|nr:hypothetical protein [Candidatus Pelagibacter sp.]